MAEQDNAIGVQVANQSPDAIYMISKTIPIRMPMAAAKIQGEAKISLLGGNIFLFFIFFEASLKGLYRSRLCSGDFFYPMTFVQFKFCALAPAFFI